MSKKNTHNVSVGNLKAQLFVVGLCLLILPFSFGDGLAPTKYILSAVVLGLVWGGFSLLHWITGSSLYSLIAFVLLVLGQGACRNIYLEIDAMGYFCQWVFVVFLLGIVISAIYYRTKLKQ